MTIKKLVTLFIFLSSTSAVYAQNDNLVVELESLSGQGSFSPFNVEFDSAASGGQYIAWPNNGDQILSSPSDGATGQAEIPFTLSQPANVQFQIRADMPNANDDSFYYKLDSGSWSTQNNTTTSGWNMLTPTTFNNLPAGDHTLRILRREDGAGLDQVTLTASAGEITGSGSGGDNMIVVRALGTTGIESITLRVGGTDVQSWALSTAMMDYAATTNLDGDVTVAFTNDNGDADVQIDFVQVNGQTRQAENQSENTGAWGNDQCGGGSNTEWLHCNGHINFGPVSGSGGGITGSSCSGGNTTVVYETIVVDGSPFDGNCNTYTAGGELGDGSQDEGQDPIFRVENGATLRNVFIGSNGADGIHVYNGGTVENVHWSDVGEDALTIKSSGTVNVSNIEGYDADDKFFQINAASTLNVSNCIIHNAGKALRQNGGTTFKIDVSFDRCDINNMGEGVFRTDSSSSTAILTNSRLHDAGDICIGPWAACSTSNIEHY